MPAARVATVLLAVLAIRSFAPERSDAKELFEISSFANKGRSVAAEFADLNGDGRVDLFVVALVGLPPEERRTIRVYLQGSDGSLPDQPSHRLAVPHWSAVYDVADVIAEHPGEELVLLRPDGVTILSLADDSGRSWSYPAPGPTTVGLADDERGFEPYRIVYHEFGPEPRLVVPQIGQLSILTPGGKVEARLAVPRRANYFIIASSGLIALESDFQIFLDVPKLSLGDVDGDGRLDIVSATRHEIRVFLRREDGTYPFEPDRLLPLRRVTPRDHIRGSGGVASEVKDIDGDGRLDLLIAHVQGSFTDATTVTTIHMNRDGGWHLDAPDQTLRAEKTLGSSALYDIDGDGHQELLRIELKFSLFELVELLLSREVDARISLQRFDGRAFAPEPWMKKKLSVPLSFDTFRPRGFIPVANVDLNGDGLRDLVTSGDGDSLDVYLGETKSPFDDRSGRQKMDTAGVIHFRDLDGDGLPDFVLFDPHNFDVPVRVGRNRGKLPGPKRRRLGPADQ